MDHQTAQEDGRDRITRNAQSQRRDQRTTDHRIVRGFRGNDADRVAGAEGFWFAGVTLGIIVGDEPGDAGTGSGNDADDQADDGCPEHGHLVLEDFHHLRDHPFDFCRAGIRFFRLGKIGDDFGDGVKTDQGNDQRQSVEKFGNTQGEAEVAGHRVHADNRQKQPESAGNEAFEQVAIRQRGNDGNAEERQ